jgi:hypothetical protein
VTSPFATELLGWKRGRKNFNASGLVPNCADTDSGMSVRLAAGMLDALGVDNTVASAVPADPGGPLEDRVRDFLATSLPALDGDRHWQVARGRVIWEFAQYRHLHQIDRALQQSPALRVTIGTDYLIKPDVTVGLVVPLLGSLPVLHAAVSCKWTIRSDRVQNVRHEFNQMIRHRRGRQPHLVAVTAEPLPSRLASIARGTGEVDAVYHVAFDALADSVGRHANAEQRAAWEECVSQDRLLSFDRLADALVLW